MRTDKGTTKKKKLKLDARFFSKLLVILVAFSMLVGTFYYALLFFSIKSMADSNAKKSNITMRIGIFYNDKINCSYKLTSETGFEIGQTNGDRIFTKLSQSSLNQLYVSRHCNLKFVSSRYEKASETDSVDIGAYHVDIVSDKDYAEDIKLIKEVFPKYNAFPAYIDGVYHVCVGQFAAKDEAEEALVGMIELLSPPKAPETTKPESSSPETTGGTVVTGEAESTQKAETDAVETAVPDTKAPETTPPVTEPPFISPLPEDLTEAVHKASIRTPISDGVAVIDPLTNNIKLIYKSNDGKKALAVGAVAKTDGTRTFMKCYHGTTGKVYDGYFEFSPISPTGYYGLRVVNLVKLDNYVVGVCSAEIPTWWPIETIKAFSVAARSFAVTRIGGHTSFGADLCNEACCQVFNGYGPSEDRVWRAIEETAGIVAVSNGKICGTYYSSSTGGCTANCTDVWGSSLSSYPYLKAVATPWEKYQTYNKGQVTKTVTGKELYQTLENAGYTALTGPVTDVKITKTGNNTTYVTEIKFYDANGNCQTVTRADRIKRLLGSYLYSANFVVTKAGEDAVRTNYTMMGFGATVPEDAAGLDILGNPTRYSVFGNQMFSIVTSGGTKTFNSSDSEKVITGSGEVEFNMSYALDSKVYPTIKGVNGEILPDIGKLGSIIETESIKTEFKADSFTFIGRGWGHGVGLSQYGIYELGNLGYDYKIILCAYYSGISFMTYAEYLAK